MPSDPATTAAGEPVELAVRAIAEAQRDPAYDSWATNSGATRIMARYVVAALAGESPQDEVTIPRWAAELATTTMPRLCSVCLGLSPSWDGHSKNPPCIGAAREAIQEALDGIPQRSTGVAPAGGKL